jgi:hypothetical protein
VTLFGLNPRAFCLHHLLSLWLVVGMTFVFLRQWVKTGWAAIAVLMFLCSAPCVTILYPLTNRHYLEGLLFSILVLHLFILALRKQTNVPIWFGMLFYALAVTAKETYVVLPFLLPLIPESTFRHRLRMASPFFLILMSYGVWRRFMLERWMGGYFPSIDWAYAAGELLNLPCLIFGDSSFGLASFFITLALLIYIVRKNISTMLLLFVSISLLLGSILPAMTISDPQRLLFFFCWTMIVAIVFGLSMAWGPHVFQKFLVLVFLAVIGFSIFSQGWKVRAELEKDAEGYAAHGRFILSAEEQNVLWSLAKYGHWYANGMLWLRENVLGERNPVLVFDEFDLNKLKNGSPQVFRYDSSCRCIRDISKDLPGIMAMWSFRLKDADIHIDLSYRNGYLYWKLSPFTSGAYSLISYSGYGSKLYIPQEGAIRTEMQEPMVFRIRYDSPEGWTTYSSVFRFEGGLVVQDAVENDHSSLELGIKTDSRGR